MGQIIHSKTTDYAVLQLVGKTPDYNVYIVQDQADDQEYLLKIAADATRNGLLDREAFLLQDIREEIERRNDGHKRRNKTDHGLGYQRCYPRLAQSFLVPEQGNRRANIIAIYGTESVSDLVPIEQWRTREQVRLDPKSSAWIMGRLLKIFTLSHPFGIEMGKINGGNILVNPHEHHVVLFDWTHARHHDGVLSSKIARREIADATKQVVLALGGDLETGKLPPSDQLTDSRYEDYLRQLAAGRHTDPVSTGAEFYELIGDMWESAFHPFTTIPI